MGKRSKKPTLQDPPGKEKDMQPRPKTEKKHLKGSGRLQNKTALISGGDSGIGRAVAVAFAKEGADIAIAYLGQEEEDALETKRLVEAKGRKCLLLAGDLGREDVCIKTVEQTVESYSQLDIVVNNCAEQHEQDSLEKISEEQLERTFRTNIFSFFYLTKAALKYLKPGSAIINTASVTAYRGSEHLIDYASTKGAIVAFTRSLAKSLVEKGIRVNGVAPGPIWTPLIVSSFPPDRVEQFGKNVPMGRPGQPEEVAPAYVFLASDESSYMTGQVLHINGGEIVNG